MGDVTSWRVFYAFLSDSQRECMERAEASWIPLEDGPTSHQHRLIKVAAVYAGFVDQLN